MSKQFDAGIILGGGRYDENTLTLLSTMRLDKGWDLYQRKIFTKIILPGANYSTYLPKSIEFKKTTAKLRKEYLVSKGKITDKDIVLAEQGRDTITEAFAVREKAKEAKLKNMLLITSERHMPRALFIFKRVFGNDLRVQSDESSEVETGDILLEEEEKEYLSLVKDLFGKMPKIVPTPISWESWYSEHLDFYMGYMKIHDKYNPPGKESQAYTGVKK